jgi:hypothetical protein
VTDTGTVPNITGYDDINSLNGGSPQALLSTSNGTAGRPINPIALNYLKLFPAPTNTNPSVLSNNFTISPNKTQNANTYDARVDHEINDKNLLFARFSYNTVDTFTPPNFGVVNGLEISGGRFNFDGPATDVAQQYVLGYTHIFNPSLLLDLREAFTRINNLSLPLNYGKNADQAIGFPASMTAFSPFNLHRLIPSQTQLQQLVPSITSSTLILTRFIQAPIWVISATSPAKVSRITIRCKRPFNVVSPKVWHSTRTIPGLRG